MLVAGLLSPLFVDLAVAGLGSAAALPEDLLLLADLSVDFAGALSALPDFPDFSILSALSDLPDFDAFSSLLFEALDVLLVAVSVWLEALLLAGLSGVSATLTGVLSLSSASDAAGADSVAGSFSTSSGCPGLLSDFIETQLASCS